MRFQEVRFFQGITAKRSSAPFTSFDGKQAVTTAFHYTTFG